MVKTFFDEALTVNFYADDIFRSQKDQWTMYGDHATLTKDNYNSAREIGVRVVYKFNSGHRKYKGSGAGNAEKSRFWQTGSSDKKRIYISKVLSY